MKSPREMEEIGRLQPQLIQTHKEWTEKKWSKGKKERVVGGENQATSPV